MFSTSESGHASGLLRQVDQRYPFSRNCLSHTSLAIRRVSVGRLCSPPAPPCEPWLQGGGSVGRQETDWDRARWELGSQGDKKCIDLGSSRKKEASSSRSGGLATIGNHVLLRRASLPKAAPSLFLPPWRGVPRPLPALRSPRPPRCRVCVGDGAGDLARLQ